MKRWWVQGLRLSPTHPALHTSSRQHIFYRIGSARPCGSMIILYKRRQFLNVCKCCKIKKMIDNNNNKKKKGESRKCPRWLWTLTTLSILKQTPPNLATFPKTFLETIWYVTSWSNQIGVSMATVFWQACFSKFLQKPPKPSKLMVLGASGEIKKS